MITTKELIKLNQVAQGGATREEATAWFQALDSAHQTDVLRELAVLSQEAGALDDDVDPATKWAGLKATHTPSVLLRQGGLRVQLAKVANLHSQERPRAFLMLLGLFVVADARRRRDSCKGDCGHWWHADLSDEQVVAEVLRRHS